MKLDEILLLLLLSKLFSDVIVDLAIRVSRDIRLKSNSKARLELKFLDFEVFEDFEDLIIGSD